MDVRRSWCLLSFTLLAGVALGGEPLVNWPSPPTWSPPRPAGIATFAETNPLPFIAVTPCRIADTRGLGFTAQAGPPALSANVTRDFQISGTVTGVPAQCAIPLSALAVSFQFTIIQPSHDGNLIAWPGGAAPTISVLNWPPGIFALGNGIVVPVSASGALSVRINGPVASSGHLTIDVNGYYPQTSATNRLASGEFFGVFGTRDGDGVIVGENDSGDQFSAGIRGKSSTSGDTYGVWGSTASAPLITSFIQRAGVRGESENGHGVVGVSRRNGVTGFGLNESGTTIAQGHLGRGSFFVAPIGVLGLANVLSTDAAGVWGGDATGGSNATGRLSAGVRGESANNVGVYGFSKANAVVGDLVDSNGATTAFGGLGIAGGTAGDMTTGPWGVFAGGKLGATMTKHFVEPHPSDPTQVILYTSLEGREAGTYFRGSARTVNRHAVIEVPEDFRIVTEEEGLTVQLTAVGGPPTMYVASKDLRRIVVRSASDLEFDYLVQGFRRGFKDLQPVQRGGEFTPRSADDKLPAYVTADSKRRLIANGTYNADGTVNLETAERVGWTRMWREKEERDRTAAETARTQAAAEVSPH